MGLCGPDHWALYVTGAWRPNLKVIVQCTRELCGLAPGTQYTRTQQPMESCGLGRGKNNILMIEPDLNFEGMALTTENGLVAMGYTLVASPHAGAVEVVWATEDGILTWGGWH